MYRIDVVQNGVREIFDIGGGLNGTQEVVGIWIGKGCQLLQLGLLIEWIEFYPGLEFSIQMYQ